LGLTEQRNGAQDLLQVHELPRDELGDREPDDIGAAAEVAGDAPERHDPRRVVLPDGGERLCQLPEDHLLGLDAVAQLDRGERGRSATRTGRSSSITTGAAAVGPAPAGRTAARTAEPTA
jgi:hypothetical protein